MRSRFLCDATPNRGAACEVDLAHSRMRNHGVDDSRGVGGAARDNIQAAGGEARVGECASNGPVAARGEVGGFQDCGVASGEGCGGGADAKDVGRIPGDRVVSIA